MSAPAFNDPVPLRRAARIFMAALARRDQGQATLEQLDRIHAQCQQICDSLGPETDRPRAANPGTDQTATTLPTSVQLDHDERESVKIQAS